MTKRLYLILTLFALCIYSNAQTGFVKRADRFMSLFRFNQAAAFYKKAVDADANDIAALEKLGQSFVYMKDFQSAEAVYKTLSDNPLSSYEAKFKYYEPGNIDMARSSSSHQRSNSFIIDCKHISPAL